MDGAAPAAAAAEPPPARLAPAAVRWFSHRAPHSARAAREAGELPHRGALLRFAAADSAALEAAFRADAARLERAWWAEEGELLAGPEGGASAAGAADAGGAETNAAAAADAADSSTWAAFAPRAAAAGEAVGVPVRGGAFEVDLERRLLRAAYWPAPRHRVLRGTWFLEKGAGEWVPLREALADQLEGAWAARVWARPGRLAPQPPDGAPAARVDLTARRDAGLYALFSAGGGEAWLCRERGWAWLARLPGGAPPRLRLRRGYEAPAAKGALEREADLAAEAADEAAAAAPVERLVLAVHGIGQMVQGADIAADAAALRAGVCAADAALAAAGEGCSPSGAGDAPPRGRVEVLPIQWRRSLALEAEGVARGLQPPGIPALRGVLHATAVEVLLYMAEPHRARMLAELVAALNAAYAKFRLRNPGFAGGVSLAAHSLGGVLAWDVLTNQGGGGGGGAAGGGAADSETGAAGPPAAVPRLDFAVDRLVLLGSPLGCFLALRGVGGAAGPRLGAPASAPLMRLDPHAPLSSHGLPAVARLYNLYSSYDPVAYRLEPLAGGGAAAPRAAYAPCAAGGRPLHLAAAEAAEGAAGAAARWGAAVRGAFSLRRGAAAPPDAAAADAEMAEADAEMAADAAAGAPAAPASPVKGAAEASALWRVAGGRAAAAAAAASASASAAPAADPGRVDFVLQESTLSATAGSQYLLAMGAHFSYWADADVALFVARAARGLDVLGADRPAARAAPAAEGQGESAAPAAAAAPA